MVVLREFLAQNPDVRIQIGTSLLKAVVNYDVFKCHPGCSVGRDESIEGSDIDGRIVVTKNLSHPKLSKSLLIDLG